MRLIIAFKKYICKTSGQRLSSRIVLTRCMVDTDLSCLLHEREMMAGERGGVSNSQGESAATNYWLPPSSAKPPRRLLTVTWTGRDWLLVLCHDPSLLMLLKK